MRISDWSSDVCSSDLKTRTEAVGQRTTDRPEDEIEEAGGREDQRHSGARGAEGIAQRQEKRRKTVGGTEGAEHHEEGRQHHQPAVEQRPGAAEAGPAHLSAPARRAFPPASPCHARPRAARKSAVKGKGVSGT